MKNLLKKLAKAKEEIGAISKDSNNPFFKSAYFDINQLLEHTEPILAKNGLLITQPIIDNKVYSIIHELESGETIESSLELPNLNDPQKIGSCISYYRRYTLTSLIAVKSEDDDGNKASKKPKYIKTILSDENINSAISKGTQNVVLDGINTGKFSATESQIKLLKA